MFDHHDISPACRAGAPTPSGDGVACSGDALSTVEESVARLVASIETGAPFDAEVGVALQRVERVLRRLEGVMVAGVGWARRHGSYLDDGHLDVTPWLAALTRAPRPECSARVATARLAETEPMFERALLSGDVPVASIRRLARAVNVRTEHALFAVREQLRDAMGTLPVDDFAKVVRHWAYLADADGAERRQDEAHDARRVQVSEVGDTVVLDAAVGLAQGQVIASVLAEFEDREFRLDVEAVRADGGTVLPSSLPRTPAQRRADALFAVFVAAATALPTAPRPRPLVNILIDERTFDEAMAVAMGGERNRTFTPDRLADFRCETLGGGALTPADAVRAALIGDVRRVVRSARSEVIDLGRRVRLFGGPSREAVWIQGARCAWPGCGSLHCEVDHIESWRRGGTTTPSNGLALCRWHNRFKETGFCVDTASGRARFRRPDGSAMVPV
ncbi:MAG: hypothetical protein RIS41_100 [Actinomycetota bacterium]|jgi:hypothetical protein